MLWHGHGVNLDRRIALIAGSQHGAFNHRQAAAAGASRDQIKRRLESGEWTALDRGTYGLESSAATWHREVIAAVLSKNRAFASGFTAGRLHRLPDCWNSTPEITIPFTGSARSAIARVRRRSDFTAIEVTMVDGIPVSSVPETVFDLARVMRPGRLRRVIDHALALDHATVDDLRGVLTRVEGSRLKGTVAFRESIAELSDDYVPSQTALERLLFDALEGHGLPPIDRQVSMPWWDRLPHRVDAVIHDWRLILEADGRAYHTKRDDFERDRERDNLAVAHGYRVMRFTWRMLTDGPEQVLRLVREAGRVHA